MFLDEIDFTVGKICAEKNISPMYFQQTPYGSHLAVNRKEQAITILKELRKINRKMYYRINSATERVNGEWKKRQTIDSKIFVETEGNGYFSRDVGWYIYWR